MSQVREGEVTYSGVHPAWVFLLCSIVFAGMSALALFGSNDGGRQGFESAEGWVVAILFISFPAILGILAKREEKLRAAYTVCVASDHIRSEHNGNVVWKLAWHDYIGYRRIKVRGWMKKSFALVDRGGNADYPLPPFGFMHALTRFNQIDLKRLLEINAPIGGELPSKNLGWVWKLSTVWIVSLSGAAAATASAVFLNWYLTVAVLDLELFRSVLVWVVLSLLGLLGGVAALLLGLFEAVGRGARRRRPAAPQFVEPRHHRITLYDALSCAPWLATRSAEGIYRPHDTEATRLRLRNELKGTWLALLVIVAVSSLVPIFAPREALLGALVVGLFFLAFWMPLFVPTMLNLANVLKTVGSTFRFDEQGILSMDGPEPEQLTFVRMSLLSQHNDAYAFFLSGSRRLTVDLTSFELTYSISDTIRPC